MADNPNGKLLIDWLKSRTPDDWHKVAADYNWDNGLAPLDWIVSQPLCDRATALLVFWRAVPDNVLRYASEAEAKADYADGEFRLCVTIAANLRAGFYRRSEITFSAEDEPVFAYARWRSWEDEHPGGVLKTLPDMHESIDGRIVEPESAEFQEGYPKVLWPLVWPASFRAN